MANPNLKAPTTIKKFLYGLILPNADTFENVLGNGNNSTYQILWDLWLWSRDGSNDYQVAIELYAGAGTPICNHTGITATTTANDALGTTALGGPTNLPVPATLGQQVIRQAPLLENYSIAIKPVGATNANKVALWLAWSIVTDI
ncbi:hypothetical protein [Azospirillum sp. sgz301742]